MGPKIAVEGAPGTQWDGIQGTGPALTALYSYCRLRAVTSAMAARGTGPGTGVGPGKGAGTGAGPDEAAPQPHRKLPQKNFRAMRKRRRDPEVRLSPRERGSAYFAF